ncbi:cysteine proteinase precursor [Plasmodium cynomolgi strain B]|uniref:Cysteine proteinase n=1 Tax=Plasmodium cynomolgi (strain B) TaxID=1120755 RepID=K6UZD3_PLACD|nr:cysteine proteinase precursor [Plasmodium cynomolgi strain B]GAB68005.1 cysteine proteinase precursor [Plasmodium cynomolgi strain B]
MTQDIKIMNLTKSSLDALNRNQMLSKKSNRKIVKICMYTILTFVMCGVVYICFTVMSSNDESINQIDNLKGPSFTPGDGNILNKDEIETLKFIFSNYPHGEKNIAGDEVKTLADSTIPNVEDQKIKIADAGKHIKLMKKYNEIVEDMSEENKEELTKMLRELLKKKMNKKKKQKKDPNGNGEEGKEVINMSSPNFNYKKVSDNQDNNDEDEEVSVAQIEDLFFNLKYASKFFNFMKKYNRSYKDITEQMEKYKNFKMNYLKIKKHNETNQMYKMRLNQFSDYSKKDFESYFKKLLPIPDHLKKKYVVPFGSMNNGKDKKVDSNKSANLFTDVPEILDYREKGIVHEPKDQGLCGNVECMYAKEHNKTILTLSEQEVVDCSKLNFGCDGGHPFYSFIYAIENGICLGSDYKYIAMDNLFCLNYRCKNKVTLSSVGGVKENELIRALNEVGPVSVNVGVTDDFSFYDGGIFNGTCTEELNHSVLLVGYGQVPSSRIFQQNNVYDDATGVTKKGARTSPSKADDGIQYYWIIKNSWSKNWGENGFMRISRNKEGDNVFCGIGVEVFYPIL